MLLIPSLLRTRHLYRLAISPLTLRDLSKVIGLQLLQSGGKNAAGGDYSSCEYIIGANHRHHGKTGEKKQGKTPIVVRDKAGFLRQSHLSALHQ